MSMGVHLNWQGIFRLGTLAILGFASGLPLALTGATLQAWMAVDGVDIVTIGFLGLVAQPYAYKFLWAPFFDRIAPPLLGRRTGWIFLMQLCLVTSIVCIASLEVKTSPVLFSCVALAIAFFSATQDIVFDAYRTELLTEAQRGVGSVLCVYAYRVAMLISGGGAIFLSYHIGFPNALLCVAGLMALCMIITGCAPDPKPEPSLQARTSSKNTSYLSSLMEPLRELIERRHFFWILMLIVGYKVSDAFANSLLSVFLIRELQFTTQDVGVAYKTMGFVATLIGIGIGGGALNRLGLYRALLIFGILQTLSNLLFYGLTLIGHQYGAMASAIFVEQLTGGLGTAALMVLLMALCNRRYTATQFALFSAIAALGRIYVSPISGYWVKLWGWPSFFIFAVVIGLPVLGVIVYLKEDLQRLDAQPVEH
jgi:PAT family beta-lactamase induction signal transducer AmpG